MELLTIDFVHWLKSQNMLEILGVITGLACVYLAAKNNILNWPIAMLSVGIYIVIFWQAKLYADMGLQFYFMATNVYGWYFWSRHSESASSRKITHITKRVVILSIIAVILSTALIGYLLGSQTDASFPFIDSFCMACSLVAQFLLARKVVENWLIWIFVDLIYVGVYLLKSLDLTAIMYGIYIYIAFMGYRDWLRAYSFQRKVEPSSGGDI